MASYEGSAVHIFIDNVAYPDELRKVLDQPDTKDLPLVVIPVAGEFRGGKSFLLSYFIRYLTKEGFGDEDEELIGFDHQQCRKPVTQGIKIWNKPLIVKKNHQDGSEQRIVVLLMDTQGILGGKEDNNMSTKVFALSTLLSSIMVFNLINQLNEGVLNYLKLFASYAKEAAEGIENEAPFQKLLILIRDWTKDENFGFYGGMEYLKEYFEDEKEEAFGSYFKETSCFLMPSPGKKVRKDNFNGCLRDLDEDFKQNLMTLIKGLCKPDHLAHFLKNVAGHTITAGQFCDYFGRCAKLVHKEDWTTSNDIVEMKSEFVCESAKHEALNVYSSNMDTNTDSFKTLITSSQLDVINKNARKEAKMRYTEKCKFPRSNAPQFFEKYMDKLMEELKQSFAVYEKQHQKELEARSMKDCDKAKEEAMGKYKSYMTTETNTKDLLTKGQLMKHDKDAKEKAGKIFNEKCRFYQANVRQTFDEYEKKLSEEMKQAFAVNEKHHQRKLEVRSMKDCDKAKEEAIGKYKSYMTTKTKTKDLLTKGQLMEHDKDAKKEAGKIFNENCIFYKDNVRQTFDEYEKKLSEDMKQSFVVYEEQHQQKLEVRSKIDCEKAKEEAIGKYNSFMTTGTKTKDLLTKSQLMKLHKDAKEKAGKIFKEKCSFYQANVGLTFDENDKKLSENMENQFADYKEEHAKNVFRKKMEDMKNEFYDTDKKGFLGDKALQTRIDSAVTISDDIFNGSSPSTCMGKEGVKKNIDKDLEDLLEMAKSTMKDKITEEYRMWKKAAAGTGSAVSGVSAVGLGIAGDIASVASSAAEVVVSAPIILPVVAITGAVIGSIGFAGGLIYLGCNEYNERNLKNMVMDLKLRHTQ